MRDLCRAVGTLFCVVAVGCGGQGAAQGAATGDSTKAASSDPTDACGMFSATELAAIVGNPVVKGQPFAGPEVCKWDAEQGNVTVLLMIRPAGSDRAKALCSELPKAPDGQRVEGLADIASWKFSNTMGLFNSGELQTCSRAGYVSVSLDGKADEARLRQASETIVKKVLSDQ